MAVKMKFDDIKRHFGSVSKAAQALGVHRQAVYRWEQAGVPEGQQYRIQVLTHGKLRAQAEQRAA